VEVIMSGALFVVIGIAFVLAWIPLTVVFVRAYRRFQGVRLVVCPETISAETVTVAAGHAAWTSTLGTADLRLASCSRWPHKCSQKCLEQIESSPEGCLVRERLKNWWEESACARCGTPIGALSLFRRRPGLLGPGRVVRRWRDLTPETLPEMLATHRPLCASCVTAAGTRVTKRSGTAA
jgi:hypothetical protein